MNMVTKVKLQLQPGVMSYFPETSLSRFTYHLPGVSQTQYLCVSTERQHTTVEEHTAYYLPGLSQTQYLKQAEFNSLLQPELALIL